jgi:predicted nucleic acid-binding protein
MILHLDTSALVKLYVREAGSADVVREVSGAEAVAVATVAYPEARAAFARLLGAGSTTRERHAARLTAFNGDWERCLRIDLAPDIARSAGDIAEIHALRGVDAIHLASALWLRDRVGAALRFMAFDLRLVDAARSAGLAAPSLSM